MKKIVVTVLIILIFLAAVSVAQAAGKSYKIDELHMSVDIPEDWVVFSQNIDKNDPNIEKLGLNADDLMAQYKAGSIFLNCIIPDPLNEIVITKIVYDGSTEIYDFNTLTDDMLKSVAKLIMESKKAKENGVTYTSCTYYTNSDIKYVVLDLCQNDGNEITYGRQYYTIVNGQAINITLHSYKGPITEDMAQKQKTIIDSVKFEKIPNPNASAAATKKSLTGSEFVDKILIAAAIGAVTAFIAALIIGAARKKKKNKSTAGSEVNITAGATIVNNPSVTNEFSDKENNEKN